ncbi:MULTISPECIES: hypothetical protein [unclassified Streptomyces]|uniref:hypothetical protein n=1 Tax=unclassified Streptomyces TaxID=2593676 RepID=UPI00136E60C6|nr:MULTISPECIES: hypothetical protein [unclassified Streptomyces]MYQ87328.1 hypothetical protein [Streptomyces sp. SID4936]
MAIATTRIMRPLRGERGKYFGVREDGLVHGSRRGAAGWSWNRVTMLRIEGYAGSALATWKTPWRPGSAPATASPYWQEIQWVGEMTKDALEVAFAHQ